MQRAKTVTEYFEIHENWESELIYLRDLLLTTELEECIKWGAPTYTISGKNVLALGAFKSYVGIWFFQGALLSDPHQLLVNAQEGKTLAMRHMKFNSLKEMNDKKILFYVHEAIQNQKDGKVVAPRTKSKLPLEIPFELQTELEQNSLATLKFNELSMYKQKEYAQHIAKAKRDDTKLKRLEKIIPMIEQGIGLNDKYRNC